MPHAVVITGLPGSGKGEATSVLVEMGREYLGMGDTVRRWAGDNQSPGEFAAAERQEHGDDIWARRTLERAVSEAIVIDGCRSMAELKCFRSTAGWSFQVLAILAPIEMRHSRLLARNRPDSREDPFLRDRREIGWGIAEIMAKADIKINNTGSLSDLGREIRTAADISQ